MSSEEIYRISMVEVKRDIYRGIVECHGRGLLHAAKWLTELNFGIDLTAKPPQLATASGAYTKRPDAAAGSVADAGKIAAAGQAAATTPSAAGPSSAPSSAASKAAAEGSAKAAATAASAAAKKPPAPLTDADRFPPLLGVSAAEADAYQLARNFFDNREYTRAAFFTQNCTSVVPHFLHYYSKYMYKERRRLDSITDSSNLHQPATNTKEINDLLDELRALHQQRKLDGYGLYLYGIVLKRIDLTDAAVRVLSESVRMVPTLWSSWIELAPLITDREQLARLLLPDHWMRWIFTAHCMIELFMNDEGLRMLEDLQAVGFRRSTYLTSQMAIAYHNKRNVDKAISIFQSIQQIDPFRLENLDIFSNLLFVKEMKKEMAFLAHKAVEINKYRPETCCVIGNYYSIRSEHQKAIVYFQRALKLDPQYLSAWTLMGHEFMEMKNTNAAIQSYRKTVEVSRRDYRAWYGLGQAYEILKMPSFSVYYYKIAQQLRPYDSRMLVALGETYEKLEKHSNALRCFQKACNVGDIEGIALLRLADLHKKLGDIETAVPAYLEFCSDERAAVDKGSLCRALVTLGNYYESVGQFEQASHFAYRCLEYDDTKLEARSLLKTIENNRGQQHRPLAIVAGIPRSASFPAGLIPVTNHSGSAGPISLSTATSTTNMTGATTTAAAAAGGAARDSTVDYNEMSMDESDMVLDD